MGEETVWTFVATDDVSPVMDEITASVEGMSASVDAAASSIAETSATIAESMQAAGDAIAEIGTSATATADEVGTLSEAMTEVASASTDGAASLTEVGSSATDTYTIMTGLAAILNTLEEGFSTLDATMNEAAAAMQEVAAAAAEAAVGEEAAGTAAADAAGLFATLGESIDAAMGPLMMIGAAVGIAGGALVSMGMDGQKGEALLRGAAGASQSDLDQLMIAAQQLGVSMSEATAGFYQVESAGYSGAPAIQVFTEAMKLAEGEQAHASDVMSGLTAIMHDYGAGANQATYYTDLMAKAVFLGKQSMQDFAMSIGPLASVGENVGISFAQVAAAEATMTQVNPHVRQDTQQLMALFQTLSPTMGTVAKSAETLGLKFNEAHYANLDLLGKLEYLAQLAGGTNTAAFVKLTGGVRGSTAAIDLLKGNAGNFIANLNAMGHATGSTEAAFRDWENTIPAALGHVGAAFSIFATKLMDALGPKVIPIINGLSTQIGNFSTYVIGHMDQLMPVFEGLAIFVGTTLVAVFGSLAVSVIAATWPLLAIAAAVALVAVGAMWLYQHWTQVTQAVGQSSIWQTMMSILQQVGAFLVSTFTPVWQQLVDTFNNQLKPAWDQLVVAVQPLMPLFIGLGELIGSVLIAAIAILVGILVLLAGTLVGIVKGFAGLMVGLVQVFGGIVQIVSGALQIVSGIISLFIDLVTGNFSNMGNDLHTIWGGIVMWFQGIWNIIVGIFKAAYGLIVGFTTGWWQTVVGIFTALYNALVGHSIIPDMINKIVSLFQQLPAMALKWGTDMMQNLIHGIQSMIGNLGNTINQVASAISSHLHFTKPDVGPLADADQWMPHFMTMLSTGMTQHVGQIQGAANSVASAIAGTNPTAGISGSSLASGGNNNVNLQILGVLQAMHQTMQQQGQGGGSTVNQYINHVGAVQNPQQAYNLLNQISGYAFEGGLRGSSSGLPLS